MNLKKEANFKKINSLLFFKIVGSLLLVAISTGSLVAFFLYALDLVSLWRHQHNWLLYWLPLSGILIYYIYNRWGKAAIGGNNTIIHAIHHPNESVTGLMAPLVLVSTLITHLFGGSAGREGTAVQMGGSIAATISKYFNFEPNYTSLLLCTGLAAGFGAVFGTPFTAAVFAVEVIAIGSFKYHAFLPCLIASFIAHLVCMAWGAQHTHYAIQSIPYAGIFFQFNPFLVGCICVSGIAFGLVAYLFITLEQSLKKFLSSIVKKPWLIPIIGGVAIILLTLCIGNASYNGLGVKNLDPNTVSIVSCFKGDGANTMSWLWKLVFTVITLSTGFKGGEVTPLFFIGAALGNTIATYTGMPVDLFAALGFIAVFAAASNTPIACTMMGIEMFGYHYAIYFAMVCLLAYLSSGKVSLYTTQKNLDNKYNFLSRLNLRKNNSPKK